MRKLAPLFVLALLGCPSRTQIADRSASVRECESDSNCEAGAPKCIHVNRQGNFSLADEPIYSMCVTSCDGAKCADSFRCVEHRLLKLVASPGGGRIQQMGVPTTEHYCVPVTRYGTAQIGQSCARDEDCEAAAPYCANGECTRLCASGCPAGLACRSFQRITREGAQNYDFCFKAN